MEGPYSNTWKAGTVWRMKPCEVKNHVYQAVMSLLRSLFYLRLAFMAATDRIRKCHLKAGHPGFQIKDP